MRSSWPRIDRDRIKRWRADGRLHQVHVGVYAVGHMARRCWATRFHASRRTFEDDVARRRRSNHRAYTWGDVFEREVQTAAELATLRS
jgi:hypothetical protein